jgi:hypothetical protein
MFNLEKSIADWGKQMLAAGIKTPVPLEELESHLREDIGQQIQSGTNPQQAFENSVQRIGRANDLKGEFKKTCGTKWNAWLWWIFLWQGSVGLVLTVTLNLLGRFVFHRSSSIFFSDKWWVAWSTSYILWTSFLIIGLAVGFAKWRWQHKDNQTIKP